MNPTSSPTSASVPTGDKRDFRLGDTLGSALAATLLFSLSVLHALHPLLALLAVLAVVAPFPLVIQRLRGGLGASLMAASLSVALVGVLFSPGHALSFGVFLLAPGMLIGEAMARGRGLRRGCAWAFGLLTIQIAMALIFAGPQMSEIMLDPLKELRSPETLAGLRTRGSPPEAVEAWVEQASLFEGAMKVVYPAAFIIGGALLVLVNAALLRWYLARRDPGWLEGGEFEGIRWPLGLPVAFVAAAVSLVVPPLRPIGYNVLLVLAFFFVIQGLAVVAYFTHRLAGPPFLRAAVVALVVVNLWASTWAPPAVALLGLFDHFLDFRRFADPPKPEEGR
jgi:uncharacterized protein YybS (DUF2232 family)